MHILGLVDGGELIRLARQRAGLTQVELARRAGVGQSMVSAYENGRRDPTSATLDRLLRASGYTLALEPLSDASVAAVATSSTLHEIRRKRRRIISLLERGGARHPRVFGSVARGDDIPGESDIDVMVDLDPGVSIVRLIGMQREISELLGRPVDLVPADSLKPAVRERALADSLPL